MSDFDLQTDLFQERERKLIAQALQLDQTDGSQAALLIRSRIRNLLNKYRALVKRRRLRSEIDQRDVERTEYLAWLLEQITPTSSSPSR